MNSCDTLIIGGGLVGASIAYGLNKNNARIIVLDEGDRALRASRGNFGLVWVQGKGWNFAPYAQWSLHAAKLWPQFNAALHGTTGIDLAYQQCGGMEFCLSEKEWQDRSHEMENCARHTNGNFNYEMRDHSLLLSQFPQLGKSVVGAAFSAHDGHVNPLYLLRALHEQMNASGVAYQPNQHVQKIKPRNGEYYVQTASASFTAGKIVLCAGLDNTRLATMLGMPIPIEAVRGEILITERVQPFLSLPTLQIRQTLEGSLQIGDSHEHVGENDGTRGEVIAAIARRAVQIFPFLQNVQLLRAWGALRIMTPDGYPVYHQSHEFPGAFTISTHSGVSLAAAHAGPVAKWVDGAKPHPLLKNFNAERFNVSTNK